MCVISRLMLFLNLRSHATHHITYGSSSTANNSIGLVVYSSNLWQTATPKQVAGKTYNNHALNRAVCNNIETISKF